MTKTTEEFTITIEDQESAPMLRAQADAKDLQRVSKWVLGPARLQALAGGQLPKFLDKR